MNLIYYRGLNCHLACIINIANLMGINYIDALANLWSETNFTNNMKHNIYVSKRVYTNLEELGIVTEMPDYDKIKSREFESRISNGALLIIGMDSFYIPWHPVFNHFHTPHYFFAQKETSQSILCFDPVYNESNIRIKSSIFDSAFEISHVYGIDAAPYKNELEQEAGEVLEGHPKTIDKLLTKIINCKDEGRINIEFLIKEINAMINNRYMFEHYIHNPTLVSGNYECFFNNIYFSKWEAVRNGLYKASIIKDNKNIIDEVYALFSNLMNEEITMAKKIIA